MTVLGLGPFFWSLILGTTISMFLERDGWREATGRRAKASVTPAGSVDGSS